MLIQTINYLRDPHLVAHIQEFFGIDVREYERLHLKETRKKSDCIKQQNGCGSVELHESELNGYVSKNVLHRHSKIRNLSEPGENSSSTNDVDTSSSDIKELKPLVRNYFWYYLFLFSTELGDEIFYTTFIPFVFWNIDAVVGRKVVLVWSIIMTIGQILKDIICWPRPECPPAVRLQKKWSEEYGMPSTHACISVAIPFSMLIFTTSRYNCPIAFGITIVLIWCSLICISRLYLGMHTVLDVIAGLLLAIILMIPLVPLANILDYYLTNNFWALFILICTSITLIVYYPCSDRWTSTRSDTTMVVSVVSGINFGTWLNNKTGLMLRPLSLPPYDITWPTLAMFLHMILRTVIGFCCMIPNKYIYKYFIYKIMCAILGIDATELKKSENSLENKNKTLVDLLYKFIFSFMFGIYAIYFLPRLFYVIGLERPAFYTEV
ncbi:sphingosine-1-phosphate phosphatase 2-like [Chelonus insularis]|uniref:sphingosine-1-phosphate phosphatase 2-like n=1 Tax=Chelonus insularis TaxID=460826 RepID=UPI00158F5008|nr:sphingosine-1-phosphate phosphatase 2-like [Chelonus insularis]